MAGRAKADKAETATHEIVSTLAAPTSQDPKTHDEKVAAINARLAEMRKDPERR